MMVERKVLLCYDNNGVSCEMQLIEGVVRSERLLSDDRFERG